MEDQNKNLILALVLSTLVIIVWTFLFPPEAQAPATLEAVQEQQDATAPVADTATGGIAAPADAVANEPAAEAPRVTIQTPELSGTISLLGGRIDDLKLTQYHETIDDSSPTVTLLSPSGTPDAYFASFGWAAVDGVAADAVPGPNTLWTVERRRDADPGRRRSRWPRTTARARSSARTDLGRRQVHVHRRPERREYRHRCRQPAPLRPARQEGMPSDLQNFFILHEGLVRMTDGTLEEVKYKKMLDFAVDPNEGTNAERQEVTSAGWIGYTDKYWMTTLIPEPGRAVPVRREILPQPRHLSGRSGAGAAVRRPRRHGIRDDAALRRRQGVGDDPRLRKGRASTGFIDCIDWGWFFFLTKPIFWVLHHLQPADRQHGFRDHRADLLPQGCWSSRWPTSPTSRWRKMKELQPEMEKLKERSGDDKAEAADRT